MSFPIILSDVLLSKETTMRLELLCPGCGLQIFDYEDYESMVMLAPDKALMQFGCPTCGLHLSIATSIPPELQAKVREQLDEAVTDPPTGVPSLIDEARPSIVCYSSCLIDDCSAEPMRVVRPVVIGAEGRAYIEYFKRQLEAIESVDEALSEIDASYRRPKDK
jgi:predicted RNA-binding Zn-ribbon protein involved in translation (DUF1610 family)